MNRASWATAAAVIGLAAARASATTYEWNFTAGQPGANYAINNTGGIYRSVSSTYDTVTQRLRFSVTFGNQTTKGFALSLSNAPGINGSGGQYAMLYFDACSLANPRISVYAYNGANNLSSWLDGDATTAGNQAPDRIVTGTTAGFVNAISAANVGAQRVMTFDVNLASVNSFNPTYTTGQPWRGMGFDSKVSIWMHQLSTLTTTYGEAGPAGGYLTQWDAASLGYFVGNDFHSIATGVIPLPTAAWLGMGGLTGLALLRRHLASGLVRE